VRGGSGVHCRGSDGDPLLREGKLLMRGGSSTLDPPLNLGDGQILTADGHVDDGAGGGGLCEEERERKRRGEEEKKGRRKEEKE